MVLKLFITEEAAELYDQHVVFFEAVGVAFVSYEVTVGVVVGNLVVFVLLFTVVVETATETATAASAAFVILRTPVEVLLVLLFGYFLAFFGFGCSVGATIIHFS